MGDFNPGSDLLKSLDPFGLYSAAENVTRILVNPFGGKTKDQLAEEQQSAWAREQQRLADEELANNIADKVNAKGRSPISNTTINYYTTSLNPNSGQPVELPVPPQSRLKPIAQTPDTHGYTDKKQPVITVENSIANRKWGGLLHQPLSSDEIVVSTWDTASADSGVAKKSEHALKNLNGWAKGSYVLDPRAMSVLFLDKLDTASGSISQFPLYGTEALSLMYASFRARSSNTGVPAVTTVPKKISTDKKKSVNGSVSVVEVPFGFIPGSEDFETIEVPEALIGGKDNEKIKLDSSAKAFAFLIHLIDAIAGEFPLKIAVEAASGGLNGNQALDIKIPNIAEGIAEIFGLLFHTNQHTQIGTILATKNLSTTAQNLISSNVTQDIALATADYLGFKMAEVSREITLPLDPLKDKISELLKESKQKYKSYDFQDDKNLQHHLVRFNDAAAIIKSALYKRFDANNLDKEIRDYLSTLKGDGLSTSNAGWREFLNSVENGFSESKTSDKDKPYQTSYSRRPLIRDLTHDNSAK